MARYTGPKTKIARKFGEAIFGEDKAFEKRNYPPGQHGLAKKRGKKSEYAVQLMEKQKAKYTYGILEKQFRNLFKKASAASGVTGEILLQLCEARLDNVVYRMGIAPSRRAARQIVSHRHITVNGEVVNVPSYHLKAGDKVAVREKSKSLEAIDRSLAASSQVYEWITWNNDTKEGTFVAEVIAGQKPHINYLLIPGVVYTWPEVAAVGYTEEQLKEQGRAYKTGKFPFLASGRARASMDTDGLVKVLADAKTDEILGVHMIGPRTADMIAEAVVAMEFRASAEDISRMSHAHPTYTEAFKEACLAATDNRALHV